MSFPATKGGEYFIKVAGKWPGNYAESMWGDFFLRWYPTPAPGLAGAQFSPASGSPGVKVTLTGTNLTGATEVLFNGAPAAIVKSDSNKLDIELVVITPTNAISGPITVVTPHGTATSSTGFTVDRPVRLAMHLSGKEQFELEWPSSPVDFALETTDVLANAVWQLAPTVVETQGANRKATITIDGGTHYFRLHRR